MRAAESANVTKLTRSTHFSGDAKPSVDTGHATRRPAINDLGEGCRPRETAEGVRTFDGSGVEPDSF